MTEILTALAGPFAVFDTAGECICHSPRQTKSNADSRRKREVRGQFLEAAAVAGLVAGNGWILCVDGKYRPRGKGESTRDGYADAGHMVAVEEGGAWCLCSLVPQEGRDNRASGAAAPVVHPDFPLAAWQAACRAILLRDMTGTKRARAA